MKMYENVGFKIVDENEEAYIMVCELQGGEKYGFENRIASVAPREWFRRAI